MPEIELVPIDVGVICPLGRLQAKMARISAKKDVMMKG